MDKKKSSNKTLLLVSLILFSGILLRVSIIHNPVVEDERKNVIIAESISFDPQHLNLPVENPYVKHPLLNVYLTKFGVMLLGPNDWGIRLFHLIAGILTLLLFYLIGKEFGEREGIFALFLIAFNQFHIHSSVRAVNECLLLCLSSFSIYLFLKMTQTFKLKYLFCLAFISALTFLTKATSLLLFGSFLLYLIFIPNQRVWFKKKELYLGIFIFILCISPWLIWVSQNTSSQLAFSPSNYQLSFLKPRLTAINFYLIQFFAWIRQIDYRLIASWDHNILDSLTGAILLIGVGVSFCFKDDQRVKYLILLFFCNIIPLTFVTGKGLPNGEFWWASISLIPAIILTSISFIKYSSSKKNYQILLGLFCLFVVINAVTFTRTVKENLTFPPRRFASFVDENLIVAQYYIDHQMWEEATSEIKRLLRLSPNDVQNHSLLGWLYYQKGQTPLALEQWFTSLKILPNFYNRYNLLPQLTPKLLQDIHKLTPQDSGSRQYFQSALLYFSGQAGKALNILEKTDLSGSYQNKTFYLKGLSYAQLNKMDLAIHSFQEYLQGAPNDPFAYFEISKIYRTLKEREKERQALLKAIEINPDNAEFRDALGNLYLDEDNEKEAQKQFQEAKQIRLML